MTVEVEDTMPPMPTDLPDPAEDVLLRKRPHVDYDTNEAGDRGEPYAVWWFGHSDDDVATRVAFHWFPTVGIDAPLGIEPVRRRWYRRAGRDWVQTRKGEDGARPVTYVEAVPS